MELGAIYSIVQGWGGWEPEYGARSNIFYCIGLGWMGLRTQVYLSLYRKEVDGSLNMELGYILLYSDEVDGSLNMELGALDSIVQR